MKNLHNKVTLKYSSIKEMEEKHKLLLELINHPVLDGTAEAKKELQKLELKGLKYLMKISQPNSVVNKKDFIYDDVAALYFAELGLALERKEHVRNSKVNVLEKTHALLNVSAVAEKIEQHLGMIPRLVYAPPIKPVPKPEKEEEDTLTERVELDQNFLAQELIAQAKRDADLKETILNNGPVAANGQMGASLVVDLDATKIENTIKAYDAILNPVKSEEPKGKKQDNSKDNKKKLSPRPKPEPKSKKKRKPGEKPDVDKKQAVSMEEIQQTIANLRGIFLRNQENAPVVLEQEQIEVLVKPDVVPQSKENAIERMLAMQQKSRSGIVPDSIQNEFGAEERKVKARLR